MYFAFQIAMSKVEWMEEQRVSKQTAVDNAIKLTEAEWKSKLESTLETEVDNKVEEGWWNSHNLFIAQLSIN